VMQACFVGTVLGCRLRLHKGPEVTGISTNIGSPPGWRQQHQSG
jgi:hypothetical protein